MNLLNLSECSRELKISVVTLRRIIKRGEMPYRQIGKRQFFTTSDIEGYLKRVAVPVKASTKKACI